MPGIELVLNEAALHGAATNTDVAKARTGMALLVLTMYNAVARGVNRVLRVPENFYNLELAQNYTIAQWRNDNSVEAEYKQYFGFLAQKAPYIADIELPDNYQIIEVQFDQLAIESFRVAYACDWLLVSILFDPKWDTHQLQAVLYHYKENDEIETNKIILSHASKEDHIFLLCDWIVKRLIREYENGQAIWNHRNILFPDIEFAPSVRRQVEALTLASPGFDQIINELTGLNCYCRNWKTGAFDIKALPHCTPETPETLRQEKAKRTFRNATGDNLLLNYHLRFTPDPGRIYFDILPGQHSVCVGHIGDKI